MRRDQCQTSEDHGDVCKVARLCEEVLGRSQSVGTARKQSEFMMGGGEMVGKQKKIRTSLDDHDQFYKSLEILA